MLRRVARLLRKDERGQEYVEFALLLPVLLLLVMGIIDFGRVLNTYLTVTHGAREGARLAAVGYSSGEVVTLTKERMGNLSETVNVSVSLAGSPGQPVAVTVNTNVPLVTGIITEFLVSNPYPVSSTAQMRYEGPKVK